jgi:hypothetical protein
MTITIFEDHDCKGKSQVVSGNIADLKGKPADKPGSIRLTQDSEAVLLFKNDDWHGGALYVRGPKTVSDLGKDAEGGRMGFGNSVRSVRVTPFTVDLNISVVMDTGERLPGSWRDRAAAEAAIRDIVAQANAFLDGKRALLRYLIARIRFRLDPKRFDISNWESWILPGEWKEKNEIDVVFVQRFSKEPVIGRAKFPCFGQAVIVAAMANQKSGADSPQSNADMAAVLAHEIGHYLGLSHGSANDNANNIMFDSYTAGTGFAGKLLLPDQIREMHDRLANNISRKGDRNE